MRRYELRRGQWWSVCRRLCMPSSGRNEWNVSQNTVMLAVHCLSWLVIAVARMMSLRNKKLEIMWMEAVVVQFKISHLYLHRKTEENHENPQWGQSGSWPRFEPGTSRMWMTLFLRNPINRHPFKTESSMTLLPKHFFISCLEFFNSLPVTTFKIHRDGVLIWVLTARDTLRVFEYCLVNPEMSAGDRYCSWYEYPTKNRRNLSACSKAKIENTEQEETKEERALRCDENRYKTIRRTEKGSSK